LRKTLQRNLAQPCKSIFEKFIFKKIVKILKTLIKILELLSNIKRID